MSEEEYNAFKNQEYLEEKMETSIYDLQIEDPLTMYGGGKGPYSHLDPVTEKEGKEKKTSKYHKDNKKKKINRKRCSKGYDKVLYLIENNYEAIVKMSWKLG